MRKENTRACYRSFGLAGTFYQIKADGLAYPVEDSMKKPFAVVSFFAQDDTLELDTAESYKVQI